MATLCTKFLYRPFHVKRVKRKYSVRAQANSINTIGNKNTTPLSEIKGWNSFYILMFDIETKNQGMYTLQEIRNDDVSYNHIIAFRRFDEAIRYKTLLEAEMNKTPNAVHVTREDIELQCEEGFVSCLVVNPGALVIPPRKTVPVTDHDRRTALLEGNWSVKIKDDTNDE